MIERKKKLRLTQLVLLILGILIIYFTYYGQKTNQENEVISSKIKKQISKNESDEDVFYNIEYTGLDINGNRYLLKSEEAYLDKLKPELVYMSIVNATFYFKDDTVLYVSSKNGTYNNKTLDMKFENNVKADYESSELFAEKAEYSNSESYLSIYENVKDNNINGNLIADKLLFDITNQKLDITSFNDSKINANVKLDEKRF